MIELQGIVRGNSIELISPVDLQEGTAVWVRLQTQPPQLSLAEKQVILHQIYGAWASDPSIPVIFTEIADQRAQATPRSVNFDTP
jgi:hypothetical protein